MKVLFWQNIPSHIQGHALREFSFVWPDEVYGVWCSDISADRRSLGWQKPDPGRMVEINLSADYEAEVRRLVETHCAAIHVFSGLHSYPPIIAAFNHAVRVGATNLALMVEPGIGMGWRGLLRPLRAWALARRYRPHIRAILAMGQYGVRFYQRAGFSPNILYPYMYQCDSGGPDAARPVGDPVRLVYVGKFIPRKGVDVMIRGLGHCNRRNWRLTIIGDGPELPQLQQLARDCGVAERIEWAGVKPSSIIPNLIAQHDLCLVPSRFEGWGVVTNEALMAGLAVLCSDRTTSVDLVRASGAGAVFKTGNPCDLARVLDPLLASQATIFTMKQRAIAYRSTIAPQCVGAYLRDVLSHVFLAQGARPAAAWLRPVGLEKAPGCSGIAQS